MQKIVPYLWFDTQAFEAAEFYISLFENSKITNKMTLYSTPSGEVQTVDFELAGINFAALSAGPYFTFNPSISLMIACESEEEVDRLYNSLIIGGRELMPLGEYGFSKWYAWISDQYGLNWQIMLVDDINVHQKIRPSFLFGLEVCGKAKEAITYYESIFKDSKMGNISYYSNGEANDPRAVINYSELELYNFEMVFMDHGYGGESTFNEAFSFMIQCVDQAEIDYYWDKLSYEPEVEACGWVKDQFGISWQIVPAMMSEIMSNGTEEELNRVTKAFLEMKKFDIEALEHAKKG
jgi:Uncharacterized protein conserved in bacteria